MKVRNGFVSNSSSGSFVVARIDWKSAVDAEGNHPKLITEEQEKKLLAYGFQRTRFNNPDCIEVRAQEDWVLEEGKETQYTNLGYASICNSEEITCFLIELGVPFKALNHYGHEAIIWDGKGDIIEAPNLGNVLLMYGYGPNGFIKMDVTKTDPKKWVEGNK